MWFYMIKPTSYLQYDAKWANLPYRVEGKENSTIRSEGCGTTSAAMVIASLKDPAVTPVTTSNWSMQKGYKAVGCGTYYSYFVPQFAAYGIKCQQVNNNDLRYCSTTVKQDTWNKVKKALQNGDWVITVMMPGIWTTSGHYIVAYGIDKYGNVYINDPASTNPVRLKNTFKNFASQMKYAWIITIPKQVKVDRDVCVRLSPAATEDNYYITKDNKKKIRKVGEVITVKNFQKGFAQIKSSGRWISMRKCTPKY